MSIIKLSDPIKFNGVDITSVNGWTTTVTNPNRFANDVQNYGLSYSDSTTTTSAFLTRKNVNINGVIAVSGRELLETSISDLKRIVKGVNKDLIIAVSGEQRLYRQATIANISIMKIAGGYAEIELEFTVGDPYNYSQTNTEVLNRVNATSGNQSYPVIFAGTANQLPVFTYTVDALNPTLSQVDVTISNPTTGDYITISRAWAVADVAIIDTLNSTVTVNDEAFDFTGRFPAWEQGAGFINYTDQFTSRQFDLNVVYAKRYE